MPPEQNLYDVFRAGEIDSAELSEIALWHFHSANDISSTEVVFGVGADNETYALKFVYKKEKHRIAQILAGASLKPDDISELKAKIDLEVQAPEVLSVAWQTLFTDVPVAGWFRYRDTFQIMPVPEEAPKGSALFGGHPFLVQFKYRPSLAVSMLHGYRIAAKAQKIHLLLAALLRFRVLGIQNSRFHWVLTETSPIRTEYRQEMYDFPDSGKFRNYDSFAAVEGIPPLDGIEPQDYYSGQVVLNAPTTVLQIPANLEAMLDRFFASSEDDQDRFLRACFWFNYAAQAALYSDSAAFTALISAIESLIPQPKPVGQCPVCQRPMGSGSTKRLVEFLNEFAPATPKFQEARSKLYYGFRSGLSHGGVLSFSDRRRFFAGLTPEAIEERNLSMEVSQLVRIVLVNWLHSRHALLISVRRG